MPRIAHSSQGSSSDGPEHYLVLAYPGLTSTASTAVASRVYNTDALTTSIVAYDFSGDGRPDIAWMDSFANIYVSFATSTGYAAPMATGVHEANAYPHPLQLLVGDIDGSGTDSIVTSGGTGTACGVNTCFKYYIWNGTSFQRLSTGAPIEDPDGWISTLFKDYRHV